MVFSKWVLGLSGMAAFSVVAFGLLPPLWGSQSLYSLEIKTIAIQFIAAICLGLFLNNVYIPLNGHIRQNVNISLFIKRLIGIAELILIVPLLFFIIIAFILFPGFDIVKSTMFFLIVSWYVLAVGLIVYWIIDGIKKGRERNMKSGKTNLDTEKAAVKKAISLPVFLCIVIVSFVVSLVVFQRCSLF
jgi:hypothetical protein